VKNIIVFPLSAFAIVSELNVRSVIKTK
jgi:hypothetical protein